MADKVTVSIATELPVSKSSPLSADVANNTESTEQLLIAFSGRDENLENDGGTSDTASDASSNVSSDPASDPEFKESQAVPNEDDETNKSESTTEPKGAKEGGEKAAAFTSYVQSMEERVAWLEKKMQKPMSREAKKTKPPSGRIVAIPKLRKVRWAEFKNKWKNDKRLYAIEALVGEEKFWYQRGTLRNPKSEDKTEATGEIQPPQIPSNQREAVKRVRINSTPLLTILSDVIDFDLAMVPTVLMHPFKLLVHREIKIREHSTRLEEKWSQADKECDQESSGVIQESKSNSDLMASETRPQPSLCQAGKSTPFECDDKKPRALPKPETKTESKVQKEDLIDSLETLRDLRCLVRFMDEYVFPTIPNDEDTSRRTILFGDLWHLLKPGDEIFIPRLSAAAEDRPSEPRNQSKQIFTPNPKRSERYQEEWRIICCGGGRANLYPTVDDDGIAPTLNINPFSVLAYYVDFNGQRYIPVPHCFDIKPYEGECDIVSLELYPSRYLTSAVVRRNQLIARGLKYEDFKTFRHERYKGTTFTCQPCGCSYPGGTTSANPEPVDSHVVVDFAEAIQDDCDWAPEIRSTSGSCNHWREVSDSVPVMVWEDKEQQKLHYERDDMSYDDEREDKERMHAFISTQPLLKGDSNLALTERCVTRC